MRRRQVREVRVRASLTWPAAESHPSGQDNTHWPACRSAVATCTQRECERDVAVAADGETCRSLDRCGGAACADVLDMCVQTKCPGAG